MRASAAWVSRASRSAGVSRLDLVLHPRARPIYSATRLSHRILTLVTCSVQNLLLSSALRFLFARPSPTPGSAVHDRTAFLFPFLVSRSSYFLSPPFCPSLSLSHANPRHSPYVRGPHSDLPNIVSFFSSFQISVTEHDPEFLHSHYLILSACSI